MSARMLRKVLREQEQQQQQQRSLNQEPELDEELDSPQSSAPSRNLFYLLDDHQKDEVEINDEISDGDVAKQPPVVQTSFEVTLSTNRKSKKKKKKNKEDPTSTKNRSENPSDLLLEDLAIVDANYGSQGNLSDNCARLEESNAANARAQANPTKQLVSSVLVVDPKFLRAENELRRIFGSKVVNSFENPRNSGSSRQMHGGRRGTYNPKKTILVTPSGHWPRWDGSLSMEFLESKSGEHFFRYVHSSSYSYAQRAFESARAIHDLNGIASILTHHPYHIESLLTIAEVLKFSGEHQLSADAIGKCLFAMECAWHSMFNPLQGNCRLEYSHDTNKPLFTALFSHMQSMDRRGCHRSALEVCKLLLSLDSEDPMGALFCIDYFSLRAEEYAWLERFSDDYRSDNSLWLFPNFSYSLAISRFYLEQHDLASENASGQTEKATSCDLMKQALMLHPLVVKKIVARAPLKDPAWTKILKHAFFGSAQAGGSSLDHLINIYVERDYIMWRFPDLQKLLKEAALQVIELVNCSDRDIRDWACVRKEAFSSETNEYSHLLVSDFSDSVPTMPPDDLRHLMVAPHMAHEVQNGDWGPNPAAGGAPREILNRNPMIVFLESMLPWFDFGSNNRDDRPGDHNQGNED